LALSIHQYLKRDNRFSYLSEIEKGKKMSEVIIGLPMLLFFIVLLLLFWIVLFTIALPVFSKKEKKGEALWTGIEGN
jgi:protein-S-isoprenylcysteine O-methyltransferase Ste14